MQDMKSPFKFLDSYTKDDRDIFFGREREIEELYQRIFESKIMLVYGVSGTGKSSLIHCGLSNKFSETDWLPLIIRRGGNLIESFAATINIASITKQVQEIATPVQFKKAVKSIYLDHYKPVYFIFDQFEELFIFGNKEEKKDAVQIIKALVESDIQCRFIFVMREEYMAGITEFEKFIPTIFSNRVRIEKMAHINAIEAIKGPCGVANINIEEGFAESLLERLGPESADVELTYLQVFLDKIYRLALNEYSEKSGKLSFTIDLLQKTGNVSDLLGSFLDEQIALLDDSDTGLAVLKSFVSIKGTKRQMSLEEVLEYSKTLGKPITEGKLNELLQNFVNLRILRDKDQNDKYELRHDALATKIYEKISLIEKEILEIRQFIENAHNNYHKRGVLLPSNDLEYIAPYESRLFLSKDLSGLIDKSKHQLKLNKRRSRNFIAAAAILLLIIFASFTIWALNERTKAEAQSSLAELQKNEAIKANQAAEVAKQDAIIQKTIAIKNEKKAEESRKAALNAKTIAENELYRNIKNSLSISPEKMNVLYLGISNPIKIAVSGIPDEKLLVSIDNGTIKRDNQNNSSINGESFTVTPRELSPVHITVFAEIEPGKVDSIGTKLFRVKPIPEAYATFADKSSGTILRDKAISTKELKTKIDMDFDVSLNISEFTLLYVDSTGDYEERSTNNLLTSKQLQLISRFKHDHNIILKDIKMETPDGEIRSLRPIILKLFDHQTALSSGNDSVLFQTAVQFYQESVFDQSTDRIVLLNHTVQLFEAIKIRGLADLFYELRPLIDLAEINYNSEIENKLDNIKNRILSSKWKINDFDNIYSRLNKVTQENSLLNLDLGLTEFLIKLMKRLVDIPEIGVDQKEVISNLCLNIGSSFFYNMMYKNSLDFYLIGLNADSTNQYIRRSIPVCYLLNNKYSEAEAAYLKLKNIINDDKISYVDYFIKEIEYLENKGITHPDFAKVKELLKE